MRLEDAHQRQALEVGQVLPAEDDDVMVSCVAECTQSQVFTLYTQAASLSEPTAVGQVPGNAALAVAAQRAHNDAVFYCDLDDWRVDIVSNNVSFTVLCKWILLWSVNSWLHLYM